MNQKMISAGNKQESEVNYYLDRYIRGVDGFKVLSNVRINVDGYNSQIDHLVIYKGGFIVIESKSVKGSVRVNALGEWERSYKNQWYGIPSPIQQALAQIVSLKQILRGNSDGLLDTLMGMRKGFGGRRYHCVVAVSSSARLERETIPQEISKHVVKNEFLVELIEELTKVTQSSIKSFSQGVPRFTQIEIERIYGFLKQFEGRCDQKPESELVAQQDSADDSVQEIKTIEVKCKKCKKTDGLTPHSGRHGYFVRCDSCGTNTSLKNNCPYCKSPNSKPRKSRSRVYLDCLACEAKTDFSIKWKNKS